ncbi:MAG: porin family protein [Dysgonomonas sp.]
MRSILKMSLVILAAILAINVQAQDNPLSFGVKGGFNISRLGGDIDNSKFKVALQAGLVIEYELSTNLYGLSGIEISSKGAKVDAADGVDLNFSPLYIQLPFHAGYRFDLPKGMKGFVHAGPYIAVGVSGSYKQTIDTDLMKQKSDDDFFGAYQFRRFDFGAGIGVGVELNKTIFTLGYDQGIVNIANAKGGKLVFDEGFSISKENPTVRTQNIYLTVGYRF